MGRFENGMFADSYSCLTMIANWVEALHDHGSVSASLRMLIRLVGARSLTLSRYDANTGSQRCLVYVDPMEGSVPAPRRVPPVAHILLGEQTDIIREGGLFLASEHDDIGATRNHIRELFEQYDTADIALVSLGNKNGKADFVELHFAKNPDKNLGLLALFPPILASTWNKRDNDLLNRLGHESLSNRLGQKCETQNVHLLDTYNPANLSRAEFRICALMREGLTVKKIAAALSICESTVRSHLRSVYAKTGTSCQLELLHQLTAAEPHEAYQIRA